VAFFSNKSDGVMGIDISSTGIKLIELTKSRQGYELASMATVPLPRDAIVENTIIDTAAVANALKEAIKLAKPAAKNVALAVSGNAVIIKTIQVSVMTEFELEAQIGYEADQHVPYDVDDVFLDFHIQGVSAADPEKMDVVLVACKRDIVEDFQLVVNEAGLHAKCIDCGVFAIENALELSDEYSVASEADYMFPDSDAEVQALVNIGANMMNINVLINGRMAFVRDQFYGGQNLTEEIQKSHQLSYQDAEALKINSFSAIQSTALEQFYIGLTSELVRSLDFYSASRADFPVRKLLLSGGCALLPDIATELEQRLGIDTAILNPMKNIIIPSRKFNAQSHIDAGAMMMVPLGLALRNFDT